MKACFFYSMFLTVIIPLYPGIHHQELFLLLFVFLVNSVDFALKILYFYRPVIF